MKSKENRVILLGTLLKRTVEEDKELEELLIENLDFLYTIHMEGEDREVVRERNFVEETFDLYITNADYLKSKDLL